jgi:tetratricopeptide (TPR) repeat protein
MLLAFLAGSSYAQDVSAEIRFRDGTALEGTVVETSKDSVQFRYRSSEGEVVATFDAEDLDPASFYMIRSGQVGDDVRGCLDLAVFALEHDLYPQARFEWERAKRLDPEAAERFRTGEAAPLIQGATQDLLDRGRRHFEEGDWAKAEAETRIILTLFPLSEAAEEAQTLLREIVLAQAREQLAGEGKPEEVHEVMLKDGRAAKGTVLSSTEDSVTFQFRYEGSLATTTLKAENLDPRSFYEIRNAAIGDDAKAHIALAKFAAENGMFSRARMHYLIAKDLDPEYVEGLEKEELPAVREGVARKLLGEVEKALDDGRLEDARHRLADLLTIFFDTQSAIDAGPLVDRLVGELIDLSNRRLAEARKAAEGASEEEVDRLETAARETLAPITGAVDRARELNVRGLQEKSQSEALKLFNAAISGFDRALRELERMEPKAGDDNPVLVSMISGLRDSIQSELIEAHINMGGVYLARGSHQNALDKAKDALRVDPASSYAMSFQARVESAIATSGYGKWGRVGRRIR